MANLNGTRSVLDLIGSTPVVKLRALPGINDAEVWAKMESFNPGGSVKDRICLNMIETAERQGKLKSGATIVEPTSGNTGIGLALIAAVKGYRLILTMPDTMSEERRSLLGAYGARLILTPDTKGMGGAIHKAEELIQENSDYFMPQQFNNPANPEMHRKTTAVELLKQFKRIDAFVAGVGTGGTITGVGEILKEKMKGVRICAVEPAASPVISGGEPGYHKIQGIGAGFMRRPPCVMMVCWVCFDRHFPDTEVVGRDLPSRGVPRQRNSIAADSLTAKTARCSARLGRNSMLCVHQGR